MKNLALAVLTLAFVTAGLGEKALAICSIEGTVIATEMDDDSTATGFNKVIVRTGSLADHTFSFTTADQDIMLVAVIAKSGQIEVLVTGDATSCPAVAAGAELDGGQVVSLDLNT